MFILTVHIIIIKLSNIIIMIYHIFNFFTVFIKFQIDFYKFIYKTTFTIDLYFLMFKKRKIFIYMDDFLLIIKIIHEFINIILI